MKKEDLLDGKEEVIVIPTISSTLTKNTTPGTLDTNGASLNVIDIPLYSHQIKDAWRAVQNQCVQKVITSEAVVSKELLKDLSTMHDYDAKEYVKEQIQCSFAHKLTQDLDVEWDDEFHQLRASCRRIILTEDDLFDLMLRAVAEYKASEELTK